MRLFFILKSFDLESFMKCGVVIKKKKEKHKRKEVENLFILCCLFNTSQIIS